MLIVMTNFTEPVLSDYKNLSEWGTIFIFIIYLIFQLVRDYIKNKKDVAKSNDEKKIQTILFTHLEKNNNLYDRILNYLNIISNKYNDNISETQMKLIIETVNESSKFAIKSYIYRIIRENNVESNESEIKHKIEDYIYNRFNTDKLTLREFKYKNMTLDIAYDKDWSSDMSKLMTKIVLTTKSEKSLHNTLTNKFNYYTNDMICTVNEKTL